jgi:hypothetical protein
MKSLAEETDLTIDGHHQSHYEMYIEAMVVWSEYSWNNNFF